MQHAGYVLRRTLVAIFNLISDHDDVRSLFSVNHFTLTQPTLSTSRKEIVQEEWGKIHPVCGVHLENNILLFYFEIFKEMKQTLQSFVIFYE